MTSQELQKTIRECMSAAQKLIDADDIEGALRHFAQVALFEIALQLALTREQAPRLNHIEDSQGGFCTLCQQPLAPYSKLTTADECPTRISQELELRAAAIEGQAAPHPQRQPAKLQPRGWFWVWWHSKYTPVGEWILGQYNGDDWELINGVVAPKRDVIAGFQIPDPPAAPPPDPAAQEPTK
jgi:hypothetical protein